VDVVVSCPGGPSGNEAGIEADRTGDVVVVDVPAASVRGRSLHPMRTAPTASAADQCTSCRRISPHTLGAPVDSPSAAEVARHDMDEDADGLPVDPDRGAADQRSRLAQVDVLAVVALGGMLGASARYGIARSLPTRAGHFPWATFWTNVSGSFLLGLLLVVIRERLPSGRYLRPFAATGILGAFTTMSTYQVENALLLKDGHVATALAYGLGSLAAGLALAYAGMAAGRAATRR
jgi:CrcB protein